MPAIRYIPLLKVSSLVDIERTQKNIANKINNSNYDIVFSEQDQYTYSPFFLKFVKKPTVYYCPQPSRWHEAILQNISENSENNRLMKLGKGIGRKYFINSLSKIEKQNASFAKYILTNSYFSRETIMRIYGLNSFVCYLGIDNEIFRPLNILRDNYVLSVGSCSPNKGYDFIIRSLSRIDQKIRPRFVIVSNVINRRWEKYLKRLSLQNKIDLEIKSLIDDEELVLLYNKALLFLYAPYLEPFGLTPLESMACGTPVIAVKEGGVRESVVNNETGILTERDETMFGDTVAALLLDERKRAYMGQTGIGAVQNFWTLEHAGERLLWHLERAINL